MPQSGHNKLAARIPDRHLRRIAAGRHRRRSRPVQGVAQFARRRAVADLEGAAVVGGSDNGFSPLGWGVVPGSPNIEDRRAEGPDYSVWMRKHYATPSAGADNYWPSALPGKADEWSGKNFRGGYDPLVASPLIATARKAADPSPPTGAYAPSFQQNLRIPARRFQPPQAAPHPLTSASGLPYLAPSIAGLTLNSNPWGY